MKTYINDLVSRVSEYSEKLENTSLFVDHPWVAVDNNDNYHKYIFKRNGELIMSLNGDVLIGKWEYLTSARSILIDRVKDKILLNHTFFDPAVMILKPDGLKKELFILANETIIPDLDVKKYLRSLTYKKINLIVGILEDGKTLEIYRGNKLEPEIGMKVTIDGEIPKDERYKLKKSGKYFDIRDGKILKITYPKTYKCSDNRIITIEQSDQYFITKGDLAYFGDNPASSGKYKLGSFNYLEIVNGVVNKKSYF